MSERPILVIGHSHVLTIRAAAIARREADPSRPRTRTLHLLDPRFPRELHGSCFDAAVAAEIGRQVARHDPIVASAIGGSAHAVLGVIARPPRLDFPLAGSETLPLDPEAEIIGEAEAEAMLRPLLEGELLRLASLRALVGPFHHLEPPPPVRRADWVAAHAERFFTDQPDFHRYGIAPPGVRYRLWLLSCRIVREACARLGCDTIAVPRHVRGEAGLLRPSFGRDATHGNAPFGEAMIQALEAAVDGGPSSKLPPFVSSEVETR